MFLQRRCLLCCCSFHKCFRCQVMGELKKSEAIFLAFGTKGDVLPVAEVAAALAQKSPNLVITFITHAAHELLRKGLTLAGIAFIPISSPPVLSQWGSQNGNDLQPGNTNGEMLFYCEALKTSLDQHHREELTQVVDEVLNSAQNRCHSFIAINFFALEGWHLAELYSMQCVVVAPYIVPYSAPTSFERLFRTFHPLLYKRLKQASLAEVGWGDVMHWMWPLFTDRWTEWRVKHLGLAACPLTDPVTELPIVYRWPRAPLVLYGVSPEVVECPAYWPPSVHLCGFWYSQKRWDSFEGDNSSNELNLQDTLRKEGVPSKTGMQNDPPHSTHLIEYLSNRDVSDNPIFVGLSSIGSMGFLENPEGLLKVLDSVLQAASKRAILFTDGYQPLDAAVVSAAEHPGSYLSAGSASKSDNAQAIGAKEANASTTTEEARIMLLNDSLTICDDRLFCYSGFIPYSSIFSKCALVLHHGGSGTTAAALHAGIPQVICPFFHDQFYWADRMAWIGVSPKPLKPQHLMPSTLEGFEKGVGALLSAIREASTREMQSHAAEIAEKLRSEDGIGNAVCLLLEEFC
ncbi:hypothetical protein O6H91_21G011700 [Diphasiastrum complanatum]|uniref:Uncharacterized protein n=1 Tax=Diphasiastrum complanatum TaxID=34168 RepID=A0ACC2AJM0_DIPCM|nr:hypothetical protein O6H91_21G011700 [Diphasiastrum complanatum]